MTRKCLLILAIVAFSVHVRCSAQVDDTAFYETVWNAISNTSNDAIVDGYNEILKIRSHDVCSFEDVKQSLQDNEVAIETFCMSKSSGQTEYFAFIAKKEYDYPHICRLFKESELDNEINKGDALYTDTTAATLLLKLLQKELEGVKKIFFVPAGKLNLFAIEYCNVGDGKMLAEKYEFYRLTSSSIITHRNVTHRQYTTYAIFGGIDFDATPNFEEKYDGVLQRCRYGYLQDSYEAAKDIHRYMTEMGLHGTLFANDEATESTFKTFPWLNTQIFFIETHGVSALQKGKSTYPDALMLAGASYLMEGGIVPEGKEDGLLTIDEIARQNMSDVDLAVISACKSALGEIDNEEGGGLMRAFKTAGVKSLVMTTDNVVDYVSGEVWKVLFRNICSGLSKRKSLLNAIKDVRISCNGFYASPKYWTPFILIDGLD